MSYSEKKKNLNKEKKVFPKKNFIGTVINIPDITAEVVLSTMAEGVIIIDLKGYIRSWNPAMVQLSGYSSEIALGKNISWLRFDKCQGGEKIMSLLENKEPCEDGKCLTGCECFIRDKTGQGVPVLVNARVLRDKWGDVQGIIQTLTDFRPLLSLKDKIKKLTDFSIKNEIFQNMIGYSRPMKDLFRQIRLAAASEVTTLILGQSGVGKELVANALKNLSARSEGPFVKVNCGALSEQLLESELFGHARGAFTNAIKDKPGRFEIAHKGTIFLDEIGEISLNMQIKLLRVIQEGTFERVGENKTRKIDVRIIAATNRDLISDVAKGLFREDLYYRLRVFPIYVPSLNERVSDIPKLADFFMAKFSEKTGKEILRLSSEAMEFVMKYPWPGNVREFENAIEYAFVVSKGPVININELPPNIINSTGRHGNINPFNSENLYKSGLMESSGAGEHFITNPGIMSYKNRAESLALLRDPERLKMLLDECYWNKAEVGRRLGKSRTAVWKWMKKHGIPMQREDQGANK